MRNLIFSIIFLFNVAGSYIKAQNTRLVVSPVSDSISLIVAETISHNPWYIGVGGGVAFGRATFCSFSMEKTRPGFNVGIFGGYEINKIFSTELSLDYTRMLLGAYDCCQNLYLGSDGKCYYAPVSGAVNYEYKNLVATSNIVSVGGHFNIDFLHIWSPQSRWSVMLSPAIYGAYSIVAINQKDKVQIKNENKFHFGAGIDLGFGYKINDTIGIRLTSGINYYTGAIDALPLEAHKYSYVWKNSVYLTFNL